MKDELIALAKEAMSNADLIEQAREAIDNMDDFARMANVVATGPLLVLNSAIDALELADKRIAELEKEAQFNFEQYQDAGRLLCEANEKLAVARDALSAMLTHMGMDEDEWNKPTFDKAREALAQIGGEDARS